MIEAVVHLDSNYGRDLDDSSDPEFEVKDETNPSNLKRKYSGSTAYWFGQMKKGEESYEKCLLWAVTAIDITNSTHLEAAQGGREKMRDIIKKRCPDVVSLKKELEKNFLEDPDNHLIATMCQELPMKEKEGKRSNLSFASKFCSYAAKFLGCKTLYSKYDNVVASHLSEYVSFYLGEEVEVSRGKYNPQKKNKISDEEGRLEYVLGIYKEYYKTIKEIRTSLGEVITLEELDHIIWYGCKGR